MIIERQQWWKKKRTEIKFFIVDIDRKLDEIIAWSDLTIASNGLTWRGNSESFKKEFDFIGVK